MEVYASMGGNQVFLLSRKTSFLMLWYFFQLFHINCLFYCKFYLSI